MADPVSLAGTAVGIASLAIQLFSGVTSYVDRLKCQKEDLNAVNRKLLDFRASINAIEAAEKRRRDNHSAPQPALHQCLQTCKAELSALKLFWEKYRDEGANVTDLRHKVKTKVKEMSYPFHRENLTQLETRLDQATQTIILALQAIHMYGFVFDICVPRLSSHSSSHRDEAVTTSESLEVVVKNTNNVSADIRMVRQDNQEILESIDHLTISFNKFSSKDEEAAKCIEERIAVMQQLMEAESANMQWMMERMRRFDDYQMVPFSAAVGFMDLITLCSDSLTHILSHLAHLVTTQHPHKFQMLAHCGGVNVGARPPYPLHYTAPYFAHVHKCEGSGFDGILFQIGHSDRHRIEVKIAARLRSWMLDFALAGVLGNFSMGIYPSLICTRTVDSDSPGSKLLGIISTTSFHLPNNPSNSLLARVHDHALQKLKKIYEEGRASPLDIDVNGMTFIETFACALQSIDTARFSLFLDFLDCLKSWGVELRQDPASSFWTIEALGQLDNHDLMPRASYTSRQWTQRLSDIGLDVDAMIESNWTERPWANMVLYPVQLLNASNSTEYASSATQAAIINQDYNRLQLALLENPKDLEKHFTLGDVGTLAMAIFWPKGLALLVKTIVQNDMLDTQLFELGQAYKFATKSPVLKFKETRASSTTTIESISHPCHHVLCAEVLQPLLQLGIPCTRPDCIRRLLRNWTCELGRQMILGKLREQRESLKRLAVQHLPSEQIARFDWSAESVLDTEAGEISSMLESCNIYVPGILRVSPDWRSVFLNCAWRAPVVLLDLIWEAGFRHPDTDDMFGPHYPFSQTLPEVGWYLQHGINPRQVHQTHQAFPSVSHLTAVTVGYQLRRRECGRRRSAKRQVDCWQRLTAFANKSSDFLECQLQAIRLATFDEMGLAHTCCTRFWNRNGQLFAPDEEEILELLEEDGPLLQVLENLMDDFSVEFPRLGCGLREFFEGYWIQRVREGLDQSNAATLTEQQLKEAEDTGVSWDLGSMADDNSDMEYDSSDYDWTPEQKTFEYWERTIDEI
ncbi:hypothetical protein G7054_g6868 [Neopestalotiopsis clavispora]|nr:hypothetical protein G7054_g6868 [Neopestalotiopsis clavispora]